MFHVEIGKALRRWRTWLLAAALAGVPVLIVIAVKASPPQPQAAEDAPPFLLQIVRNGLFAPLTGLAVVQPFFMSLAVGLFAGDASPTNLTRRTPEPSPLTEAIETPGVRSRIARAAPTSSTSMRTLSAAPRSVPGGPSATIRPWAITPTRSHIASTSASR